MLSNHCVGRFSGNLQVTLWAWLGNVYYTPASNSFNLFEMHHCMKTINIKHLIPLYLIKLILFSIHMYMYIEDPTLSAPVLLKL